MHGALSLKELQFVEIRFNEVFCSKDRYAKALLQAKSGKDNGWD